MRNSACLLAATLAFATIAFPAVADVFLVDLEGGGDYPSIGEAIADTIVLEGDTILVAPGIYTGENNRGLDFAGKNLLVSAISPRNGDVTIDCEGLDRAFHFHSGENQTSIVEGFTIRNGYAGGNGGSIYCAAGSGITIRDCIFEDSDAPTGGAVAVASASAHISGCTFTGCTAEYGGGISVGFGDSVIEDCVFEGGFVGFSGGAIWCSNSESTITGCTISNCAAEMVGGSIHCQGGNPTIAYCTIYGGDAFNGGGIYCQIANPLITNTIVAYGLRGRGVYCLSSEPEITHCIFYGNLPVDVLCGNHHDNLSVPPLFCDSGSLDFTLCADSPGLPANNDWEESIGAHGLGCDDCGSPVESSSWGAIKAIYRTGPR